MLIDVDVNKIFEDEFFLEENIKNMEYGKALVVKNGQYAKSHIFDTAKRHGKNIKLKLSGDNLMIVCISDVSYGHYEIVKNIIRTHKKISKSDVTSKTRTISKMQRIEILKQLENECFIEIFQKQGTKKPITYYKWIAD